MNSCHCFYRLIPVAPLLCIGFLLADSRQASGQSFFERIGEQVEREIRRAAEPSRKPDNGATPPISRGYSMPNESGNENNSGGRFDGSGFLGPFPGQQPRITQPKQTYPRQTYPQRSNPDYGSSQPATPPRTVSDVSNLELKIRSPRSMNRTISYWLQSGSSRYDYSMPPGHSQSLVESRVWLIHFLQSGRDVVYRLRGGKTYEFAIDNQGRVQLYQADDVAKAPSRLAIQTFVVADPILGVPIMVADSLSGADFETALTWAPTVASLSAAGAVTCFSLWLLGRSRGPQAGPSHHYEAQRRDQLRTQSWVFRNFEGRVDAIAALLDAGLDAKANRLQRAIRSNTNWRLWTTREFLAAKTIEGLLVGGAVFVLVSVTGVWQLAVLCGGGLALTYPMLCRQSLLSQSESRLKRQRVRLPFVIDQIALMMQAGANFEESLRSIAAEEPDHPLTEELQIVLGDITAGRTRRDALAELKERIPDREFGELFFSIIKGEELGTPLSTILSEQADQMRIKRSQWGEKAAAEAEVQIVFPGMLVMIACLIVVLGPIMLPAVVNLFGDN